MRLLFPSLMLPRWMPSTAPRAFDMPATACAGWRWCAWKLLSVVCSAYGRVISGCATTGDARIPTPIAVRIILRRVFIIGLAVMNLIGEFRQGLSRRGSRPTEATITVIAVHLEADVNVRVRFDTMYGRSRRKSARAGWR